jgi:hypothetical protein
MFVLLRRLRAAASVVVFIATALATVPAIADGPAVSMLNGKISLEGGESNAHPTGIGVGSVTAPLPFFDNHLGGQLDFGLGDSQSHALWGTGAQLFARDPGLGLIGALASYNDRGLAHSQSLTATRYAHAARFGGEAAYYWQQFTPELQAGYESTGLKSGGFLRADLNWYPTDDLRLMGGGDFNPNKSYGRLAIEYRPGLAGLSGLAGFVESGISGSRASYALVGIRYYFGPDKTLIRRQREDDPPDLVGGDGIGPTLGNSPTTPTTKTTRGGGGGGGGT